MATRSTIARYTDNGIQSIYVHWEGYPKGVGAILEEHYTEPQKIDALFALGDLSSLGKYLEFGPEGTVAYLRDRQEWDTTAKLHRHVLEWRNERASAGCEFAYLWLDGRWSVTPIGMDDEDAAAINSERWDVDSMW